MFIQSITLAGKHLACFSLLSSTTILSCSISILASRDRASYAATSSTQGYPPKCAAVRGSNRVWSPFYIADLRSLCVQRGLTSTGTRKTLERRLRGSTPPSLGQDIAGSATQPGPNITNHDEAAPRPDFTEGQMQAIRQLIKDTVQQSSREIANEAAKAAVNAFRAQVSSSVSLPAQPPPSLVPDTGSTQQPPSFEPDTESPTRLLGVSFASLFQDIPAPYIKAIQSGEFLESSKLLPKNLSLYDEGDNLVLSLENSVVKVSRKTKPMASSSITNIEQWTTAFTAYMSVLIHKFPTRSQELLQYASLIRYAVRVHRGLGWAIYDFTFRQKASVTKSLDWSLVDNQLWLTIFTMSPAVLIEEYPLFSNAPQHSVSRKWGDNRATCNPYNRYGTFSRDPGYFRHLCNKCSGSHPGRDCSAAQQSEQRERARTSNSDHKSSKSSPSNRK